MSRSTIVDLGNTSLPKAVYERTKNSVIQACLDRASADIDSILAGRYPLPITPMPPATEFPADLIGAETDLAAFYLLKRIGYNPEGSQDKLIKGAYDAALEWCDDVAHSRKHPPIQGTGTAGIEPLIICGGANMSGYGSQMGATPRGW